MAWLVNMSLVRGRVKVGSGDNSKIDFLISQQKHVVVPH